jgi:hypothetical protein
MNTKINYLYRDAGNWKFRGSFIVGGVLARQDLEPFMFNIEWFVPHQVGLKHLLIEPWGEDDHLLYELEDFEETNEQDCICTAEELIGRFASANTRGWFAERF